MNHTVKLLIPLGLGLLAAIINWMVISAERTTVGFVRAQRQVPVGAVFGEGDLAPAQLPADFSKMIHSAVPWTQVGALYGEVAQREVRTGDLVFWRDTALHSLNLDLRAGEELFFVDIGDTTIIPQLMSIGDLIQFRIPLADGTKQWIGPFRLVSMDARINNDGNREDEPVEAITVAYKQSESGDPDLKLLEEFCDRQVMEDAKLLGVRVQTSASIQRTSLKP